MAALSTRTDVAGGSGLPAGVDPPLAIDAPYDHSGFIIVITAAFMGFALVFFGLRVYFHISRLTMKPDDITLILGTVSTFADHFEIHPIFIEANTPAQGLAMRAVGRRISTGAPRLGKIRGYHTGSR